MDNLSKRILEEYAVCHSMDLSQLSAVLRTDWDRLSNPVSYLRKKGFLEIEANHLILQDMKQDDPISPDTPLEISYLGRVALEEEQKISREKRNELIRYIITTTIAVAAFLKSFFFPG